MAVVVTCPNPNCRANYQVAEDHLGRSGRCAKCGCRFTLAARGDETNPPAKVAAQPASSGSPAPPEKAIAGQSANAVSELAATAEYVPPAAERLPLPTITPYIVERKLGRGGMGEVYLARDPRLDRKVAIKLLPPELAKDQARVARFLREARIAAKVQHPNTVVIYEADVRDGQAFLVMEFVDGHSLDKVVAAGKPMGWHDAAKAIRDAAAGLAAAHDLNVIHRDVKPANLMRTRSGVTKVVDFGLARALQSDTQLTQEGLLLGTPAYMAPELWMGQEATANTDLYALVCAYYRLLTGSGPYDADSFAALGYQHRHEPFPDPRGLCPGLPEAICGILARGGQKEPKDRYQSARELLADLDLVLAAAPANMIGQSRPHETDPQTQPDAAGDTKKLVLNTRVMPAAMNRAARPQRWFERPKTWLTAGVFAVLAVSAAIVLTRYGRSASEMSESPSAKWKSALKNNSSKQNTARATEPRQTAVDVKIHEMPPIAAITEASAPPQPAPPEHPTASAKDAVATSDPPPAPPDATPPPTASDETIPPTVQEAGPPSPPEYESAKRIFELGGWCQVSDGRAEREIRDPHELPTDVAQIVRVFFLSDTAKQRLTDADLENLAAMTGLRELYLNDTRITGAGLRHLARCSALWKLDLNGTQTNDRGLAEVGKLTTIRDLNCDNTPIIDAGLAHLQSLALEILLLNQTQITDLGLAHVEKMPLKSLSMKGTGITDAGMPHIGRIHTLETLTLSHTQISDAGALSLKDLANLRTLELEKTNVADGCLRALPEGLERLILDYTRVTAQGLRRIGRYSKLKDLGLGGTPVDDGLQLLRRCELLQSLNLGDSNVTDVGLAKLTRCPRLTEISFWRTALRCHGISRLPKLAGLQLSRTNVDKQGVDEISTLSELKWLFLEGNKLIDSDVSNIGRLTNLEYLNLANNELSDAILPELAKLVRLKSGLDLTNNPKITPAGIDWLRGQLRQCAIHF